jgi:hypothetical protein
MSGLPDSMQMAPHGRFETVSEDDHGSNGEIRRVRFAENEHEGRKPTANTDWIAADQSQRNSMRMQGLQGHALG